LTEGLKQMLIINLNPDSLDYSKNIESSVSCGARLIKNLYG